MLNESLYMSEKHDWETPSSFFNVLNSEFNFNLDPCCTPETAKCKNYFTPIDDGLSKNWYGNVFINPPYGREIVKWVEKARIESEKNNCTCVCLVPARTDTKWWHNYCMSSSEVRFLTKRLTFNRDGSNNNATFPAAIVIFRPDKNYNPLLKKQKVE